MQAADEALKAEVSTFLADIATALQNAGSANDPAIAQVVSDINDEVAALQATTRGWPRSPGPARSLTPDSPRQPKGTAMSFSDTIHALEAKVRAEFGHLEQDAKAEFEKLLGDAKAEAAKVEADVRAEIKSQVEPLLERLKSEIAVAVETAGPGVTAEVTKVVGAFIADLERLAGASV